MDIAQVWNLMKNQNSSLRSLIKSFQSILNQINNFKGMQVLLILKGVQLKMC
jgi:hypothetical protein